MQPKVYITSAILKELTQHTLAELPREACGIILGQGAYARRCVPLSNVAADPRSTFQVESRQLTHALRQGYGAGLEWLTIYHSHPAGPPELSPADRASARAFQGILHILCLPDDHLTTVDLILFSLNNGTIQKEKWAIYDE